MQFLFGELQLDGAHLACLAGLEERLVSHMADFDADAHGIAWDGELATLVADPETDFLAVTSIAWSIGKSMAFSKRARNLGRSSLT